MLKNVVSGEKSAAIIELIPYLTDSFGNSTRIDYGTGKNEFFNVSKFRTNHSVSGHEANFIILLLCLSKLNVLTKEDHVSIINRIFERYYWEKLNS